MSQDQVHILKHPVIAHMLAEARDERTPPNRFRELLEHIGIALMLEATRSLHTRLEHVQTPLQACQAAVLAERVTIVPILRAGMGMAGPMLAMLPNAQMGHIGMFRDDSNLEPVHYYEKLPSSVAHGPVLLVDPMLATGGSAVAAVSLLKQRGCADIRFICLIASPEGLDALQRAHGEVPVYTASIDDRLDDRGYILPGLGDAGDRVFGTTG